MMAYKVRDIVTILKEFLEVHRLSIFGETEVQFFRDYIDDSHKVGHNVPVKCSILEYQAGASKFHVEASDRSIQFAVYAMDYDTARSCVSALFEYFQNQGGIITLDGVDMTYRLRSTPIKTGVTQAKAMIMSFNIGITVPLKQI